MYDYVPKTIIRRNEGEARIYRCFELVPAGGFVVQSMDRVRLPVQAEALRRLEEQYWTLFCEQAPEERSAPCATLGEAIAQFDRSSSSRPRLAFALATRHAGAHG